MHLDRHGLEALVKGSSPYYSVFDHPLIRKYGGYTSGFHDKWSWSGLSGASDDELVAIYFICKKSWEVADSENSPLNK